MFRLSVVTPEKTVLEQEARSVIAPGSEGYLGILTDHAPLITALIPGKLTVTDANNKDHEYSLSGGFLEVSHNVLTVLADAMELVGDIDVDRARRAEQRARDRLRHRSQPGVDVPRAELALAKAINRIRLAAH